MAILSLSTLYNIFSHTFTRFFEKVVISNTFFCCFFRQSEQQKKAKSSLFEGLKAKIGCKSQ
jgi:hypothetical protein